MDHIYFRNDWPLSQEFRSLCIKHLSAPNLFSQSNVEKKSSKAVLTIETRVLPHYEYTIKLLLSHLTPDWSFYFFTGSKAYSYWKTVMHSISKNIKVINLGISSLSIDQYSSILLDPCFWKDIKAEKILVFQEDGISFKPGIDAYLKYDYVGAPWGKEYCVSKTHIGNGGVSLRSRSATLEALKSFKPDDFKSSKASLGLMQKSRLAVIPEDVFFSNAFSHLGKLFPSYQAAKAFSMESQFHADPLFTHRLWRYESNFKKSPTWQDFLIKKLFKSVQRGSFSKC